MAGGIKVSQSGKDAKNCLDKELVFSSEWNTFKIFSKGETTLTVNNGATGTKTIAHNLGYHPASFVFIKWNGSRYASPGDDGFPDSLANRMWWHYTTSSNLIIKIKNNTGSQEVYGIKYIILIEENA